MEISLKQLLEAGVHFGHQTRRWNPKMAPFIFGDRNGIHIINLEKTAECLSKALEYAKTIASEGKAVLFVGTKRQAQVTIQEAAGKCGMPYVNQRWLGGMLTNFETVRKSVQKLETIDQLGETGDYQFYTKKEINHLMKEKVKLEKNLAGVRKMLELPGAIFVVDTKNEEIAMKEAKVLDIATIALVDTNSDPDPVDYPIPGNDDAIRAIKLITDMLADAVIEGRAIYEKTQASKKKKEQAAREEKKSANKDAKKEEVKAEKKEADKKKSKEAAPKAAKNKEAVSSASSEEKK